MERQATCLQSFSLLIPEGALSQELPTLPSLLVFCSGFDGNGYCIWDDMCLYSQLSLQVLSSQPSQSEYSVTRLVECNLRFLLNYLSTIKLLKKSMIGG